MTIVTINWEGPYSVKKAVKFNRPIDIGLYQYYGRHLVFGRDSLLYIGMTVKGKGSFSSRIKDHNKEWGLGMDEKYKDYVKWCKDDGTYDERKCEEKKLYEKRRWIKDVAGLFGDVYCGRLCHENGKPITREDISKYKQKKYKEKIEDAEGLLIYACSPPWNKRSGKFNNKYKELHILNFGNCGSLPTEVSGEFWQP